MSGPGYKTPKEAINGPKEKLLFVPCINIDKKEDYVCTVDVDPDSPSFCQVTSRLTIPRGQNGIHDELHHFGWNACSSCHDKCHMKRDKLVFPCLNSDRIVILSVSPENKLSLHKIIESEELHKHDLSAPHTSHCLANGQVMISTMGDANGNSKGNFLLLDANNDFNVIGTWAKESVPFGYDFWYQPKFDLMISTEWGAPKCFKQGLNLDHVTNGMYGNKLHVWKWSSKKLESTIDLGSDGFMPLEIRFHHDPNSPHGFVGCALSSTIFHFYQNAEGKVCSEKIISVPSKTVENWWVGLTQMPGVITDILLSMDDRFLYFSNWVHGDIRQYDVSDPSKPKLTGQVFLGGSIVKGGPVTVTKDEELKEQPHAVKIKGKDITGGPQMLQLSLDGKRLYVTTSLFTPWDNQFYPEMKKKGSMMLQLLVDTEKGGMKLNPDFLVDFGTEPDGPVFAHEMRYPGGDCTSDIFMSS